MIAEMLAPTRRLTGANFAELARSIRQHAPEGDIRADSVAAALESVAQRRATGGWRRKSRIALSLVRQVFQRRAQGDAPHRMQEARVSSKLAPAHASSASNRAAPPLTHEQVRKALADIQRGLGVQPELCATLLKSGWVQWQHSLSGEIVDECHPQSLLQITPAGLPHLQMTAEQSLREECSV